MSHTTRFTPPKGWERAVLIHDGYGMPGTVELRGWYPKESKPNESVAFFDHEPDFVVRLHEDDRVEDKVSKSAPVPQQSSQLERALLYRAGVVVGAARLQAKVNGILESHAP